MIKELEKMQKQINNAQKEIDILSGRKQEKMEQLKELGFKTTTQAHAYIEEQTKVIEQETEVLQKEFEKLEEQFTWD